MKNAAVLGSWDTKRAEMQYLRTRLEEAGVGAVLVDVSTLPVDDLDEEWGYPSRVVRGGLESRWRDLPDDDRGARIDLMAIAAARFVSRLHAEGRIDGVVAAGGLQNTTIAKAAMRALPLGVPKVMATTVASGQRRFASVVGDSDIVVVPALADFTGLNFVTRATLDAACACLVGIGGRDVRPARPAGPVVGLSAMGVTNRAASAAVAELESQGFEAVAFHATGRGGAVLEDFVRSGLVDGVLELSLHEIVNEHFGGGYSHGARDRLVGPLAAGVPLVLTPGGLDFVDYEAAEFPPGLGGRSYVLHSGTLAHIKLTVAEARTVGRLVGGRIAAAARPVPLLLPTDGLRAGARPGLPMWDPAVDEALVTALVEHADGRAAVERVPLNLDTEAFGALAARRLADAVRASRRDERSGAVTT